MYIGIDALCQARGGSLVNLVQLFSAWSEPVVTARHRFVLFASQGTLDRLDGAVPDTFEVVVMGGDDRGLFTRLVLEQTALAREARRRRLDAVFSPVSTMPFLSGVPCVVTFQNAAPFCPSVGPKSVGAAAWLRFALVGLLMQASARRAARVVFVSHTFFEQFTARFSVPSQRGAVIYRARPDRPVPEVSGRSGEEILRSHGLEAPYALTVSHFYPYKNLVELIDGFARVKRRWWGGGRLVVVGTTYMSAYEAEVRTSVARAGLSPDDVVFTGAVPHPEVLSILAACELFVFPSTCENCPTALIEALAAAVPIACSNVGVMPEIVGDAAEYFDPYEPEDIASAMLSILMDPARAAQLRRLGAQRALRFPEPADVGRLTLEVIESLQDAAGAR